MTPQTLPRIALFSGLFKSTPLPEVIAGAARAGFEGVEVLTGWDAQHLEHDTPLDELRPTVAACQRHDVEICSLYPDLNYREDAAGRRAVSDRLAGFCERANALGAPFVKVPSGPIFRDMPVEDNCQLAAEWIQPLADQAADFGLSVLVEIHFNQAAESVERATRIAELVERDNFGIMHDAGNLAYAGLDCGAETVHAVAPWLKHVHLKDMRHPRPGEDFGTSKMVGTQFGEGDVDHVPAFQALIELSYTGFMTCESMAEPDSWEWVAAERRAVAAALERAGQQTSA